MTNEDTTPTENITVSPSFTVGEPVAYLKYEKKAGDYNNEGVNVSIPIGIPAEGIGSQTFLKTVGETLEHVKALAWDALRIEYTFDADKGVLVPNPAVAAPVLQAAPIGGGTPPRPPAPPATGGGAVNPEPDQNCGVCGGPTFNNTVTPKQNPRFPDFKCKNRDCQAAMWLTGKDGGTWKQR